MTDKVLENKTTEIVIIIRDGQVIQFEQDRRGPYVEGSHGDGI